MCFTNSLANFIITSTKIRKWKKDFTEYGLQKTIIRGKDRPQCKFCDAAFSNSNVKPTKLGEYLQANHDGKKEQGMIEIL